MELGKSVREVIRFFRKSKFFYVTYGFFYVDITYTWNIFGLEGQIVLLFGLVNFSRKISTISLYVRPISERLYQCRANISNKKKCKYFK